MNSLPLLLDIFFLLIAVGAIAFFYAASKSKLFLAIAILWTALQITLATNGVYENTETIPPRIMLFGILPALVLIGIVFFTADGRDMIERLDLKILTYLHTIRIPVEIALSLLFHYGVMSVYITFEGTNFDIFSGITAPIVAYLIFNKRTYSKKLLLWWNIICLLLLLNVVITAIFAFPSPFQKLAFDQPNIAVLHAPYNLLPTLIVPIVLFSHLAVIYRLMKENKE